MVLLYSVVYRLTERFIYLFVYLYGYMRMMTKYQKEKVLLSLSHYIVNELKCFELECDNPTLNRSVIVEEILNEVFTHNKKMLDKIFPNDKRFKKK